MLPKRFAAKKILVALLIVSTTWLTGATHHYNLLPQTYSTPLTNAYRVNISGPFRVRLAVGANPGKLEIHSSVGGQLSEVKIHYSPNTVTITPSRSALASDISQLTLQLNLPNPGYIEIHDASSLDIKNQHLPSYHLTLVDVPKISVSGNAIFSSLNLIQSGYFAPRGEYYLGNLFVNGQSGVLLNQLRGGAINISMAGTSPIFISGKELSFSEITNQGNGSLTVENQQPSKYSKPLAINWKGQGDLTIDGLFNSNLSLVMPKQPENRQSKQLTPGCRPYSPIISLAGYVDKLQGNFSGQSQVRCPKLYVNQAYVRTYDGAYVMLSVGQRLFANTFGRSRVEYYGHPPYLFKQSRDASAVLGLDTLNDRS